MRRIIYVDYYTTTLYQLQRLASFQKERCELHLAFVNTLGGMRAVKGCTLHGFVTSYFPGLDGLALESNKRFASSRRASTV